MYSNRYTVIMAGGVGSRFWPMSRKSHPKQFIDLTGDGVSLFERTYERHKRLCPEDNILVVTNEAYRDTIKQLIPSIKDGQILGEPAARNTAPCIAYAAHRILNTTPDAVMIVTPADHLIADEARYLKTVETAFAAAAEGDKLITLGIEPTRPDTGYGYIQYDTETNNDLRKVLTFREKPDLRTAEQFLADGGFLWNAGIFIWHTDAIRAAFKAYLPSLDEAFAGMAEAFNTADEPAAVEQVYEACVVTSIDYGIMEKADNVYVIPSAFSWSDIGNWNAIHELQDTDADNNLITGDTVIARNVTNSVIKVGKDRLVALNGLDNIIVVEEDGMLLIADKTKEQEVKQIVAEVKAQWGEEYL